VTSERQPWQSVRRVVAWLAWAALFCAVFLAAGAAVGGAAAVAIEPMTSRQAWLIGGAGLVSRSELDVRFTANLAWMIAYHPAAVAAGLLAALSAPRLGWWRVALAAWIAGDFVSLYWRFASQALDVLSRIPPDDTLSLMTYRQVAGGMNLTAMSLTAALPACIAATCLGCLLRPGPRSEPQPTPTQEA